MLNKTLLILCVGVVCGCASGPEYGQIQSTVPAVEPGKGRIYVYRPQRSFLYVGSVSINGEEIRVPEAGGVLFVDRVPGEYEIVVDSITVEKAAFQLNAAEEKYVRITVTTEGHFLYTIYPQLKDKASAVEEMQGLKYIEPR